MKHIVNFSGGACSFWAAHRVIQKHGKENTILLFADTLIEDEDLYAFNTHASQILGVPITRIAEGRTPWQLFRDQGIIGNNKFPICSIYLKREPLNGWRANHFEMNIAQENMFKEHAILYVGFDWTEQHRIDAIRAAHPEMQIEAPMAEAPLWDKCKMLSECEKLGLKIPKLYTLGFPHNNCGGRCVRAGISHWVHLFNVLPDRFIEWEKEEQVTIAELAKRGIAWKTMLKDRRGGVTGNLSLVSLRERIESGEKFPDDEWGGCGCSGVTDDE